MRWTLNGWAGTGVLEGNDVKLKVDLSVPTDRTITEQRPDLIVLFSETRDSLVRIREEKKKGKYQELAANLAVQNPGWTGVGNPHSNWKPREHGGTQGGAHEYQHVHSKANEPPSQKNPV